MSETVTVAVTGAAGNVCQSLLFRLAAGEPFGPDASIRLQLIEKSESMKALEGLAMELEDCALPLLESVSLHDDPVSGFKDVDFAILTGAKPRTPSMDRMQQLQENPSIFVEQGRALGKVAKETVKTLVVGNPANTNALIAWANARYLPHHQFSALMRLDHNRALGFLARKIGINPLRIKRLTIWGNHASTLFPDASHLRIDGQPIRMALDMNWYRDIMIDQVQQRGAAVISCKGKTSSSSAAQAIIDHLRDWRFGTEEGDFVSMGVLSQGEYGVTPGLFFSYPVTCRKGRAEVVEGLDLDDFCRRMVRVTEEELVRERKAIENLLPMSPELLLARAHSEVA
ncbi:malate dehydrogenase [Hahella aquimaris]|uniref:malate dehydrogenase n=1 Tax=Hahella sp. HNIBRBA332 TaxID=3015983 RepID=UPI00273C5279|nr:malate dehydrogenase [Hahella sp. HNIBRBA332]WLQ11361.1 malate dehydrogenase [Hahella sp. HNIBRBA332]